MLKIIKENYKTIITLILTPFIFIILFKICIKYLPGEMVGTIDGWLGFFGGYIGILGAIGAIQYQKSLNNKSAIKSMELYTNYIVENISKKLEEFYIPFLTVFASLDGYDQIYEIEDIEKKKKDFNIINADIINSNLSIILSNKKFIVLLDLKKELDSLNYYITKLENDVTQSNIFIPLMDNLDNFSKNNPTLSKSIFEIQKELNSLRSILSNLNKSYYIKHIIKLKKEDIIPKYRLLIQNIEDNFDSKNNLKILEYYKEVLTNIARILFLISSRFQIKTFEFFHYITNVIYLIDTIINIYRNIEKLKSTK